MAGQLGYIRSVEKLITLELTRGEKELVLNMPGIVPEIPRKLQVLVMHANSIYVKFTADQIKAMIEGADKGAEQAEDENVQKAYREIQAKLDRILKANS